MSTLTIDPADEESFSLKESVRKALHDYFTQLDGSSAVDVYDLVLSEVEAPLVETVMHYAKGNQSLAARWLGLSRGTLRKLLGKYNIE